MIRYPCNRLIVVLAVVSALSLLQSAGHAQQASSATDVSHLLMAQPAREDSAPSGEVDVWITLVDPSLGEASEAFSLFSEPFPRTSSFQPDADSIASILSEGGQ